MEATIAEVRPMKRWVLALMILASVVSMSMIGLDVGPQMFRQSQGLTMSEIVGDVAIASPDGDLRELIAGETVVGVNDVVRTGEGGRVILSIGDGLSIRVDESAEVKVREVSSDGVQLELENGRVTADVSAGAPMLDISNGQRTFTATDAEFTVAVDEDDLAVDVRRGELDVGGIAGVEAVVEGNRLHVVHGQDPWTAEIPQQFLLDVAWPEKARTNQVAAVLAGRAEPGSFVEIKGVKEPSRVQVGKDGRFEVPVSLKEGLHSVEILAVSVMGEVKASNWTVELDTKGPAIRGEVSPVQ